MEKYFSANIRYICIGMVGLLTLDLTGTNILDLAIKGDRENIRLYRNVMERDGRHKK